MKSWKVLTRPQDGLPDREYHSSDYALLRTIWSETEGIETVEDLERYIDRAYSSPAIRALFFGAIAYFSERKVLPNGRLDYQKVRPRQQMGYGRQLTSRTKVLAVWLALRTWMEEGPGRDIGTGLAAETESRAAGIPEPREVAFDILTLIDHHHRM